MPSPSKTKTIADDDDVFLPLRPMLARYGNLSKSTLHHWIKTGVFPPPAMVIGSRRFWSLRQLKTHDAKRMRRGVALPEPERLKAGKAAAAK